MDALEVTRYFKKTLYWATFLTAVLSDTDCCYSSKLTKCPSHFRKSYAEITSEKKERKIKVLISLRSINCLQKQTSIFTSSLLTTSGFVVVEPKRVNNILMHYLFCGTAPGMEGKHTQQCTSTSGGSWRHRTNSEGYPGGLREVHSVYGCCGGLQWRGRQSQVRYDNC